MFGIGSLLLLFQSLFRLLPIAICLYGLLCAATLSTPKACAAWAEVVVGNGHQLFVKRSARFDNV